MSSSFKRNQHPAPNHFNDNLTPQPTNQPKTTQSSDSGAN